MTKIILFLVAFTALSAQAAGYDSEKEMAIPGLFSTSTSSPAGVFDKAKREFFKSQKGVKFTKDQKVAVAKVLGAISKLKREFPGKEGVANLKRVKIAAPAWSTVAEEKLNEMVDFNESVSYYSDRDQMDTVCKKINRNEVTSAEYELRWVAVQPISGAQKDQYYMVQYYIMVADKKADCEWVDEEYVFATQPKNGEPEYLGRLIEEDTATLKKH